MRLCEPWQARDDLVNFRVVFHRARAQRIKLTLNGEVSLGQAGEMTQNFEFAQFWEISNIVPQQRRWNMLFEFVLLSRPGKSASSRRAGLEDQLRSACPRALVIDRRCGQAARSPLAGSSR